MLKNIINEALSINDEYNKNWKTIDREIFDRVILLDPKTDLDKNVIGFVTKQLILPKLSAGENIDDIEEDLTEAINNYLMHRQDWPTQLRGVGNFPTIHDFVDYALNGDESDFIKKFNNGDISLQAKEKINPIDEIYNKYYKDIDRQIFDKIISLDSETTSKSIGPIAKNLLLAKYLKGETDFLDNWNEVVNAIAKYRKEIKSYPTELQDITNFESVKQFIEVTKKGTESDLIKYLKTTPAWPDIRYLGSTTKYDVLVPLTREAAAYIAGADSAVGGPGIDSDGSTSYSRNKYGHWCTTEGSSWTNYRNHSKDRSECIFYNLMAKGDNLTADDRAHNYQISIDKSGNVCNDADGVENYGSEGEYMRRAFAEDSHILPILAKETDYAANIPEVKAYISYDVPEEFIYTIENYEKLKNNPYFKKIKSFIQKASVSEVDEIPSQTFANWDSLETVTLDNSIKKIGAQAFKNCSVLNLEKLPAELEFIGAQAFQNCTNIEGTIRLPDSLQYIGTQAFSGVGKLTLKISNKHKGKLKINAANKADVDWYSRHLKMLKTNESLELNEAIPFDLANAYKRSGANLDNIRHPDAKQAQLRYGRHHKYDYQQAEYTQISAQEAVNYLGMTVNEYIPEDENEKIQISTRISGAQRANFNSKLCNLRFLINGYVIEYDVKEGSNILYQPFSAYIPENKFGRYPFFKDSRGRDTTNSSSAVKYSDLYVIMKICDKIYLTNEYDLHINTEQSQTSYRKYGIENISKFVSTDTGTHQKSTPSISTNWDTPDNIKNTITQFTQLHEIKQKLYNSYNVLRRNIKKLQDNSSYYSEEEYNEILTDYNETYSAIRKRYENVSNKLKSISNTINIWFDDNYVASYQEEKRRAEELQKEIETKSELLRQYKNDLTVLNRQVNDDTLEFKKEELNRYEEKHQNLTNSLIQVLQNIDTYKEDIIKLKELIFNSTKKAEVLKAEINNSLSDIAEVKNTITNGSEKIATELSKQSDDLQNKIRELEDWLDVNDAENIDKWKHTRPNQTELDTDVKNLVDFTNDTLDDDNNNPEENEDSDVLCYKKFGMNYESLKDICKIYQENDFDEFPLYGVNPLIIPSTAQSNKPIWFDSLNDCYKYYGTDKISSLDKVFKTIIEKVSTLNLK